MSDRLAEKQVETETSEGSSRTTDHDELFLKQQLEAELHEVSCVVPAFNESGNITLAIEEIAREMIALRRSFEIIVVDDGSSDDTVEEARRLTRVYPVRVICLSRNFGKENAITAGLRASKGKAVIIIDADLQEPISYLKTFLQHWDDGYQMVYGVRSTRSDESWAKRKGSNLFYWFLEKSTSVSIPAHARDFRLMDRLVVNAILSLPERNRFMKGLYSWVGFKSRAVEVVIDPRVGGSTKFNFRRLFGLALTGFTSFSDMPLRVWTGIGAVISAISICYAGFIAVRTMIYGSDVAGWATVVVAIAFLGGVQLLSIGILGEYLGRIFSEVKARPGHIVAHEWSYLDKDDQ